MHVMESTEDLNQLLSASLNCDWMQKAGFPENGVKRLIITYCYFQNCLSCQEFHIQEQSV